MKKKNSTNQSPDSGSGLYTAAPPATRCGSLGSGDRGGGRGGGQFGSMPERRCGLGAVPGSFSRGRSGGPPSASGRRGLGLGGAMRAHKIAPEVDDEADDDEAETNDEMGFGLFDSDDGSKQHPHPPHYIQKIY
jgi:hypothetical protein